MDKILVRKIQDLELCVQQLRRFQDYNYDEIKNDLEKIWAIKHGLNFNSILHSLQGSITSQYVIFAGFIQHIA